MLLVFSALLSAQNTSCGLSGTVLDPGGAAIPGVKVTLTGEGNGFVRTVTTTSAGFFAFPDLTAATFTLSIEAAGFKTYRQTGIAIDSGEERSAGEIRLQLGQVSESVTVTAEAAAVNLVTGERAGLLTGTQLDEIALRGRDIFDSVSLMPGVVDTSDGRDAPTPNSVQNLYILGGRQDQHNVTVDGMTNLDTGSNGAVSAMPSLDAVAEMKVLMSAYSAENGRNPSSISIITKGGGTSFHGQASYYFRNEDLNANNYFSNEAGQPRQKYRYNIASYSIGGPVILPKARPRNLFFFFSQEFQSQVEAYPVEEVTVPTALERQGNFSKSYNTNGAAVTVQDPLNGKAAFPGNIIPISRLTPVGQAILNIFPLPNFTDPNAATRYNWNYYAASSVPYPRRTETARVDWSPRDNWQLYFSGSNNADHQDVPYSGGLIAWTAGSLNFPLVTISDHHPGRLGTLHSTNIISSSLVNEAAVAASWNSVAFTPENPNAVNRTALGINIPQRNPSMNPLNLIPNMTFSGIQNYANPSIYDGMPYYNDNTLYTFIDNVSKIHGTHTFRMGIYYEHTVKLMNANAAIHGTLSFNTDANNPLNSNNAYANALLGFYDSYAEATAWPLEHYLFTNTEWFFQDDWKAKSYLTLNYGVRFYHDPPTYETANQMVSFSPAAWNPATAPVMIRPAVVNGQNVGIDPLSGTTYNNGLVGDFVPGVGNLSDGELFAGKNGTPSSIFSVAPIAVAPRLGFAWDPFHDGKTSVRGGGGIYFDRIQGNPSYNLGANPPITSSPSQYFGTFADIAASASTGYLSPSATVYSQASTPHQQQVYNYNLQIDRRIGSNIFSVGYTGSLARHLLWERNINPVPLGAQFLNVNPQNKNPQSSSALPTNFLRPYSAYGNLFMYEFANNSNYNGLLVSFQHRMSHGLNVAGSYTFSKTLDFADAYSSAVDPFVSPHSHDYGPAAFNRAHVFTSNFFYALPQPGKALSIRPLGWVADNWELSGVVRMLTGAPLTPGYSLVSGITTPTGSASETARMEVIDPTAPLAQRFGPPPEPAGQASLTTAPWSVASTAPELGNLGKDTITGPGTNNWDLSLYRRFRITERFTGQFRLETYNTFNHTQFSGINSTAQFNTKEQQVNTAFLLPNAARPPRRVQIAFRLIF
jgi:hypothetical protein